MAEELSDEVWSELDGPVEGDSLGFSMMLKMTRCHDLGLGQLFLPDEETDEDDEDENEVAHRSIKTVTQGRTQGSDNNDT